MTLHDARPPAPASSDPASTGTARGTDTDAPRTAAGDAGGPVDSVRSNRRRRPWRPGGRDHRWVYVVLIAGLVVMIMPFVWMLLGSVKPNRELISAPPTWWPEQFTWENFAGLFERLDFGTYAFNSIFVAVAITLGNVVLCSMMGYALAKLQFRGRSALFGLTMSMLMIPGLVTFVPLFVVVANLGMLNSYAGLILPFLASPLGVFLMRQFMLGIPDELIEAARIDGASEFRIFLRVVLPLTGPAIATLVILTFLASWNNFLWPLVVAQREEMYTLPVAVALFSIGQNANDFGLMMAGAVVIVLPVLLLFVFLQRLFIQGVTMTGIK